jgi:uncharacterized phage protein (TIGR01671 family)
MRKILFRGKQLQTGEWLYADFFVALNTHAPIAWKNSEGDFVFGNIIDRDTIGQYTGVEDKNGVKIFEGDIIQWMDICGTNSNYVTEELVGGVEFSEARGCFEVRTGFTACQANIIGWRCEVIGNIYDNPKLWEAQEW